MNQQINQRHQDEEHLRLLAIFHYVMAGMVAFGVCILLLQLGLFGMFFRVIAEDMEGTPIPTAAVWVVYLVWGGLITLVLTMATLIFFCGKHLRQHRHHTFCVVMAAIECLSVPLGTILGVFTIVVLMRPSVKELFATPDQDYSIR